MPRVFLPQILWHSKDNKRCDRVYSIDFQPNLVNKNVEKSKNTTVLRLATGGADEFVHIWQIIIQDHAPQYTHFVNNNQNSDKKVEFEQPLSIKILARLVGHIGEVNSVRWSHDGRVLASGGEDRCIFLWVKTPKQSSLNGEMQGDYEEHWTRTHYFRLSNVVNSICWCPDDRVLSVSTEDGHVSLVDTHVEGTGKIRYFDGHTNFAQGVSLDPKNELLASLGSDQCLRIWKRRNQKQWKNVLVLKAARDRGDLVSMVELETNYELRKYSRYVFMSEELKTFFRRLDWSPDGRLLVAPTGIRYDKNNLVDNGSVNNLDSTVYTLYIFHRKLLNLGIPMITHQSPTGPFVVVKFCPIYLSVFDKKRQNFYNLLLNAHKNKMKPVKRKYERPEKTHLNVTNKINTYFTSVNQNTNKDKVNNNNTNNKDNLEENKQEKDNNKENKKEEKTETKIKEEELEKEQGENMKEREEEELDSMNVDGEKENNNKEENLQLQEEDVNNNKNNKDNLEDNKEEVAPDLIREEVVDVQLVEQEFEKMDDEADNNEDDMNEGDNDEENSSGMDKNEEDKEVQDDTLTVLEENDTNLDNLDNTTTRTNTDTNLECTNNTYNNMDMDYTTDNSTTTDNNTSNTSSNMDSSNTDSNMEDFQTNVTTTNSENTNNMDITSNYGEFPTDMKVDTTTTLEESMTEVTSFSSVSNNVNDEFEGDNKIMVEDTVDNNNREENTETKVKKEEDYEKLDDVENSDKEKEEDNKEREDNVENKRKKRKYKDKVEELLEEKDKTEQDNEEDIKEEVEKEGRYNFRKTRKSVIPLLFETTVQAKKKKNKTKVKKEKKEKLKLEDELQEEDYDTDLEEELSIPRFLFAAGTIDGSLCFFDTKEKTGPIAVLKNLHFCPITDISWSPDGYVCASSSSDGYITFVIFNKRELS